MKVASAHELAKTWLCLEPGCINEALSGKSRCADCDREWQRTKYVRQVGKELSREEMRVLKLSAEGLSSEEIGKRLGKAAETVKSQRRGVIGKLGAINMTHATALAYRAGLLR